jgi:hypothetical protein
MNHTSEAGNGFSQMNELTLSLVRELRSSNCRCGSEKESGHTFCRTCYYRLQPGLRKALYRRLGEGYQQAYEAASKVLGFDSAPASRPSLEVGK